MPHNSKMSCYSKVSCYSKESCYSKMSCYSKVIKYHVIVKCVLTQKGRGFIYNKHTVFVSVLNDYHIKFAKSTAYRICNYSFS